jgi:hypothetical protein
LKFGSLLIIETNSFFKLLFSPLINPMNQQNISWE